MRALVWHVTTDIRCDTVPDPRIEAGRDAIVKVTSCAIGGSDLHLYDHVMPGMDRRGMPRPPNAMRGAARNVQIPADMRAPKALQPLTAG
jgi:hypothetical protein